MAEIVIRTKGDWNHTEIRVNGRRLKNVAEFHFSIRGGRRAKMTVKQIDPQTHEVMHNSFWGDDFAKMDERPVEGETKLIHYSEDGDHDGGSKNSGAGSPGGGESPGSREG